jgi:hypothetical protein
VLAVQAAALRSGDELRDELRDDSSGVTDLSAKLNTIEAVAATSRRQLLSLLDRVPAEWEDAT